MIGVDYPGLTQLIGAIAGGAVAIIGAITAREKILGRRQIREHPDALHRRVQRYTDDAVRPEDQDR